MDQSRADSDGTAANSWSDQYTDGVAARVWDELVESGKRRKDPFYRRWLVGTLNGNGCKTVLDCACGTGPDSIILVEEGFKVVSTDASDQMLKSALKERWDRRKQPGFDDWVIEEANWLTMVDDLKKLGVYPPSGFDALLCLGGSFQQLPDFNGDGTDRQTALRNMMDVVKPGGILVIDYRNFSQLLETGSSGAHRNSSVLYECVIPTEVSVLYKNGRAVWLTTDYKYDASGIIKNGNNKDVEQAADQNGMIRFTLSSYPITSDALTAELKKAFGPDVKYEVTGDCRPLDQVSDPVYYTFVIHKPATS